MRSHKLLTVLFCVSTAVVSFAQTSSLPPKATFESLLSFNGTDGGNPFYGTLVQGANGDLYGTTYVGGSGGYGTAFEITPSGSLTTIYNFVYLCGVTVCKDGIAPMGGLALATNGNFYGTTYLGGTGGGNYENGTVFQLSPEPKSGCPSGSNTGNGWCETVIYNFCSQSGCTDGSQPYASLVQGTDGDLYGTTYQGGTGYGTIFKITTTGTLTTLHSFNGTTDGANPYGALIQATDGDFYGTTYQGGSSTYNAGTVFKITSAGKFTVVYTFCSMTNCADGGNPEAGVIQASNGDFYGTTSGTKGEYTSTVYQLTSAGTLKVLYDPPYVALGGVVQGTDGKLYGTTDLTIFNLTTKGTATTLFTFDDTDGEEPLAALVQATNGTFYGTTFFGGSGEGIDGTLFSISNGLDAFVTTSPTSGTVGTAVIILGSSLTGATEVTFDGTKATYIVVSDTEITTSVPTGAKTGTVKVTTPSGTLKSNVKFTVTK